MFADILERCRDLFSTDRRDFEYLFRRHAYHDEPSWLTDREFYANLVKGDLTLVTLQKAIRSQDDEACARALLQHLRNRMLPRFPFHPSTREEMVAILAEDRESANRTVAWAEQICQRTLYSLYGGTIHMGPYLDWYTDMAGKSWFFEHVRGMREKIFTERIHEKLKMGPLRATWDLNALHHLVELGKAWWMTGEERFASQYVLQSLDWMEKNPPNMGVNWTDEMAVARRSIAWLFALHLFLPSPAVTPEFAVRSVKMLLMHAAYLADYLRKSRDEVRPGYRLAAACALYVVAGDFPEFRSCARWLEIAQTLLPAALEEEFGDDGAHRSGSLDMHRLCCELALLPNLFAWLDGNGLDADSRGRTLAAFQFLLGVQEPDGSYQPVGASWPERVLCFGPAFQADVAGLVALAALVMGREDLRRHTRPGWTLSWLGGLDGGERYRNMGRMLPDQEVVQSYGGASLVTMREGWGEKDFWGLVRLVPRAPVVETTHDDLMHLSVAVGGVRIFTDTGSLVLDDRRGRYFDSPAAHNVLLIRDAQPLALGDGGGSPGQASTLSDGRTWIHAGRRAWVKEQQVIWHQRDLLFAPGTQTLTLLDALEGEGTADVEVSFQSPNELEIVQRGDLGCIFWKRLGLFRLHPYFPDTFRGSVERGRENGPPAWLCRDGVSIEPLQRVRYTARLKLPCWIMFWMTWNVSGANTPSAEEARGSFVSLFSSQRARAESGNGSMPRAVRRRD